MNIDVIGDCNVKDLKKGDHFMRGRWLYRVEKRTKLTCLAARIRMLQNREVTVRAPKKISFKYPVTKVKKPDYIEVDDRKIVRTHD